MAQQLRQRLISRLRSIPQPRAMWSYNPDDANGFKEQLFDPVERGDLSGEIWKFKMSDNPSLPVGYMDMMLGNYPLTHERARYIDGEWATAVGAVYPFRHLYTELNAEGRVTPPPTGEPLMYIAGVDWAASTVTCALLLGRWREGWWVVDEWRHDGARRGEMPTPTQAREMHQHLTANGTRSVRTMDRRPHRRRPPRRPSRGGRRPGRRIRGRDHRHGALHRPPLRQRTTCTSPRDASTRSAASKNIAGPRTARSTGHPSPSRTAPNMRRRHCATLYAG